MEKRAKNQSVDVISIACDAVGFVAMQQIRRAIAGLT